MRERRARARAIFAVLTELYPEACCALRFRDPFELLMAVILSAQSTDASVNRVSPALFARFHDARALAAAPIEELEAILRPIGFFRAKARSLVEASQRLVEEHDGRVPGDLDSLVQLRGVGRKTANVVLGECFGVPGITVDTHVRRLSRRMGLTAAEDPERIEQELGALLPRESWTLFSHRMIWHGRNLCLARRPLCERCPVCPHCPTGGANL